MSSATAHTSVQLDTPITIPPVNAPSWLQGTAIVYRLAYAVPPYPQVYALSRWVAPPAELITLRLREQIAAANAGFTLTSVDGNPTGYLLEVTLEQFTHQFQSPTTSSGVVQLRATLVDRSAGRIVAQQTFRAQQEAPSADAPGGVRALALATDAVIEGVLTWLESGRDPGRASVAPTGPGNPPPLGQDVGRAGSR